MLFKKKNVDIENVVYNYRKELSQKCKEAYKAGRMQDGRWWDCQACAMVELENRIKKSRIERTDFMDIKVINNAPGVKVTINKSEDGSFAVLLMQENKKTLGDCKLGDVVKIGNREYIVLDHSKETTAVITKDFAKSMEFGSNGDYATSNVRKYCNGEFLKELVEAIGDENIIQHTVKLMADDGTGKDLSCKNKVSILTADLYRRYREYLPAYGKWWWLATRVSSKVADYARYVCFVYSNGVLCWIGCDFCDGVRPFCILNSSVLVS